jgi:pimeloyl-ACP methyl ester carboxylesterase
MNRTFVLVAGAWHGGWAFRPVAAQLRGLGHRAYTLTLPGMRDGEDPTAYTLPHTSVAVTELIEREQLTDVTLVAHSWGGYVATAAAAAVADRLRKLVFWSAFVPAKDKTLLDECPPQFQDLFGDLAATSSNNTITLPFEVWQQAFINDASEPVQRLAYSLLTPQPFQYFNQSVEPLDTSVVPATYLLSSDDAVLPPGKYHWARFAERLNTRPSMTPGSHEALLTRPSALAHALLTA